MHRLYTLGLISLLLASCGGEFSYKQGASAADLATAKSQCKTEGSASPTDIALCLENNGWHVSQLDDDELFAEASVTENKRSDQTGSDDKSAFVMVEKEKPIEKTKPAEKAAPVETAEAISHIDADTTSSQPSPQPAKDPLSTYKVSSWWKFGGSPAMLEKQTAACVTELGEAHQPNYKTQTVTRGLVVCLYKKGWRALKVK